MPEMTVESRYTPDAGAQTHHLGSVMIDMPGTLVISDAPAKGQEVSFRVDWIQGEGVRPTAITVSSKVGREVTSTDLRNVNVKQLWRAAIVDHVVYRRMFHFDWEKFDGKIAFDSPVQLPDDILERLRLRGPERATLAYVADLYMFADSIGLAPALYVQQIFAGENLEPLPRTTATKWIKKARDLGIFEEWFYADN
ncbi:hypothetical protein ABIE18_000100 [Arthrobacter sp. 2762]